MTVHMAAAAEVEEVMAEAPEDMMTVAGTPAWTITAAVTEAMAATEATAAVVTAVTVVAEEDSGEETTSDREAVAEEVCIDFLLSVGCAGGLLYSNMALD